MENREKENKKFALGIKFVTNSKKDLKTKLIVQNIGIPKDIIINQLRLFTRFLEENYYPEFKDNTTVLDLGPEE